MEQPVPVLAVKKALDILDLVIRDHTAGQAAPLADLAQRMAMPRNSVHNLLKTLAACGYIEQRQRGLYVPGSKCRQLARLGRLDRPALREALTRRLRQFAETHGEDCLLTILVNGQRVVVSYVDCRQTVRVSAAAVERRTFFGLPTGRMLAAIADEAELQQIIESQGLPGAAWDDIDDPQRLRQELTRLRRQGYCRISGRDDPLFALACPVAAEGEKPWAAVGTFAPLYRCPPARQKTLLAALREMADDLAALLPTGEI